MHPLVLREEPTPEDTSWSFSIPLNVLTAPPTRRIGIIGKCIKVTAETITLRMDHFPSNRILHDDDPTQFIMISFSDFRFPDTRPSVTTDYMNRLMQAGLFLNGVQYRFYHHSNSQLRSRSCFLRRANTDAELDERIYKLGDFGKIMNIAKRAKRIGLLFSSASMDYQLDPRYITDIPDLKVGDEIFSDGCGLISKRLAISLSRAKQIMFREIRYTPSVYQIRYLGYKGVLMLHPLLDVEKKHLAQFRQSMKKFSTTHNLTFSVVDYAKPYAFGRLNNEIVVLISSLGITNESLLRKQDEYFQWIAGASHNYMQAIDFLSALGEYDLAERVLLDGLDNTKVSKKVRSLQMAEVANFRKKEKPRVRMLIKDSRLLFGVCDPFRVLKEGEVHVRITAPRGGASTLIHGDVLVARNPCLHPGDCLKLRAVQHPKLAHLVDCIVFATVARPGHRAAPSMSSGGDLDGDKFFVCWDKDLVPTRLTESYDYPSNKEAFHPKVTRQDLANHFASYNSSGVAKVSALHNKWVRSIHLGALSQECKDLAALHSKSVDGARISIPERLRKPPESDGLYIIDLLTEKASEFVSQFTTETMSIANDATGALSANNAKELILQLLRSKQNALSEYEIFKIALSTARKHSIDLNGYLPHITFGAMSTSEKYALSSALDLTPETTPIVWNSLIRSDILGSRGLYQRQLDKPWSMQRLYSSKVVGMRTFFEYLRMATQEFTRKVLVLKTDDRFAIGVFMRGNIPWDEDPEVADNVVVCSFLPQTSASMSTFRPCTQGYRLHCGDDNFQLYNKNINDTFIFITRPPAASGADIATSIALNKISARVQKQIGRVNRTPVTAIELHVVSNRDRVGHQLFDLWFEHVPTEIFIPRFDRDPPPYGLNTIVGLDWSKHPPWLEALFVPKQTAESVTRLLQDKYSQQLDKVMEFCLEYHAEDELFWTFNTIIAQSSVSSAIQWIERYPPLVFALLKAHPPDLDTCCLPSETAYQCHDIVRNIIRSANALGIASLVALEKIASSIAQLPAAEYLDLLMLAALCVRTPNLVQEILLVLNDCRATTLNQSDAAMYVHKHALAVAFDRADEAADACPCDERGRPRRGKHTNVKLLPIEGKLTKVQVHVPLDVRTTIRLHSHVRLQVASEPEKGWAEPAVFDGIVVQASTGELKVELQHPPPPEMARMPWKMYDAGSVATTKAMMDALQRLIEERMSCCSFCDIITSQSKETVVLPSPSAEDDHLQDPPDLDPDVHLNASQMAAIRSSKEDICLIWGPPGTGKTTVLVQILRRILRHTSSSNVKILMTASTHNAVDNVLERFAELNRKENLLEEAQILRVATDHSKVNKALKSYTIDARVGGDMNENNRLVKQALERVKSAAVVFTTCAGAGLGILRKVDFDTVLIDEASQITEPCALIPLVKGCQRAILVGDHVQLRPTVGRMAKALEFDVSLLERLYTGGQQPVRRTMLNVQYRFPKELAEFPSNEFYEGRLGTGSQNNAQAMTALQLTEFPWPRLANGAVAPTIFIQCDSEESMGGVSKSNPGQATLVACIVRMLTNKTNVADVEAGHADITILSPYSKQVQELKNVVPASIQCFTIDSFQGRESDIIVLSTVRCNTSREVGFVEDARRLNVAWTRARLALIIVGDRRTLAGSSPLWSRGLDSCTEVKLPETTS